MQVYHQQAELEALNTQVILLTYSGTFWLESWRKHTNVPYPLLMDHHKEVYKAYGLTKSIWGIFAPRLIWYYLKGLHLPLIKGDPFQLGGDFIVDAEGKLRFSYRSAEPTDRPSVDLLLSELRKI